MIKRNTGSTSKYCNISRVCINPYDYCTVCHYCIRGQTQFCVKDAMKTALGYWKDGGWQNYIIVPGHLCFVLPTSMSLKQSVFCQPLSTIIRGWDNMGDVKPDAKPVTKELFRSGNFSENIGKSLVKPPFSALVISLKRPGKIK